MSLIAVGDVSHPDLALTPTIRACPEASITVIPQSATDPRTGMFFFLVEDADESFDAALEDDHTVSEWSHVSSSDSARIYRMRHGPGTKLVSPKTVELGGLTLESTSTSHGWRIRLQFPDRETLAELWEYCEEEGISFDLAQMYRREGWTEGRPTNLTSAQRTALVTAYEEGYFDEPRGASLSDVAELLDISPTAVGGRIRRGSAELVETMLIEDED
ncbi:helix-turn-helix domain-containing protein [Halorarum salinum]|uniref:Helix-turn-helix domain-containing protein n=1 Tax=Halorarum salinum TaxID=2743089 RepID=A0A7D5L8K0_9EURY|nr:helix-turn-helix domain-containing protein [Halobaculum salinum]QLG60510.1 helix-turn-helix domain-containing protein [Halobaculum salinum]